MRVLVTGGRDFVTADQRAWLYAGLNLLNSMQPITEIIEGGARGADNAGANWALWRNATSTKVKLTTVQADWQKHSAGLKLGQKNPAGPIRNREMIKLLPDVVLACPGGNGTEDMVSVAKAAGVRVVRLAKMPLAKDPQALTWGPRAAGVV